MNALTATHNTAAELRTHRLSRDSKPVRLWWDSFIRSSHTCKTNSTFRETHAGGREKKQSEQSPTHNPGGPGSPGQEREQQEAHRDCFP